MCGIVSSIVHAAAAAVGFAVGGPVGATAAYSAVSAVDGGTKPEQPQMPAAPVLPPQTQAAQAPDEQARRASQAAAVGPGPAGGTAASGTMLTGAGGITKDLLNLGKNSLLGQ